jgi:hypothetical protein
VIFVDSCYFCAFDVLEMLVHSNANLVCAMDMVRIAANREQASHDAARNGADECNKRQK